MRVSECSLFVLFLFIILDINFIIMTVLKAKQLKCNSEKVCRRTREGERWGAAKRDRVTMKDSALHFIWLGLVWSQFVMSRKSTINSHRHFCHIQNVFYIPVHSCTYFDIGMAKMPTPFILLMPLV